VGEAVTFRITPHSWGCFIFLAASSWNCAADPAFPGSLRGGRKDAFFRAAATPSRRRRRRGAARAVASSMRDKGSHDDEGRGPHIPEFALAGRPQRDAVGGDAGRIMDPRGRRRRQPGHPAANQKRGVVGRRRSVGGRPALCMLETWEAGVKFAHRGAQTAGSALPRLALPEQLRQPRDVDVVACPITLKVILAPPRCGASS
jgi:hypothetical protein